MYDPLETKIAAWRNEVSSALSDRKTIVAELEDHLRSEIRRLIAEGRTPDDAFAESARRIGRPSELADQFVGAGFWRGLPRSVSFTYGLFGALCLTLISFSTVDYRAGRMNGLFYSHALTANVGFMGLLTLGAVAMVAMLKIGGGGFSAAERRVCQRSIFYLSGVSAALVLAGLGLGMLCANQQNGSNYYRVWLQVQSASQCVLFALGSILAAQLRVASPAVRWLLAFAGTFATWVIGFQINARSAVPYGWLCLTVPMVHGAIALLRREERIVASRA